MTPFFVIRKHCSENLVLLLSIAACAVAVGSQARIATQRANDQGVIMELGLESAWPHVRADLAR